MTTQHNDPTPLLLKHLAADDAPRLFAVGLTYNDPEYTHVAAYGMAFEERTDVISRDGFYRVQTVQPEDALRHFEEADAKAHLVWLSGPTPSSTALDEQTAP